MKFSTLDRPQGIGWLAPILILTSFSCGHSPGGDLPSRLSRFPDDLANQSSDIRGIYPDGWIGQTCSVKLRQSAANQILTLRGEIPKIGTGDFQSQLVLRVDSAAVATKTLGTGAFRIAVHVPPGAAARRVAVEFSTTQILPGGDGRSVGAHLQSIGFESPGSAGVVGLSDIVSGSGIELLGGWGNLETFHNETFRWIENDATVRISATKPGNITLWLMIQPGPGVGDQPFLLRVLDVAGRQVDAVQVERRTVVPVFLPVEADKPSEFRLHVDGGGKPVKNDPRILNFRVFLISSEPLSAKI